MIVQIINWLNNNKEWLFSGVGITAIIWLSKWLFERKKLNNNSKIKQINNGDKVTQIGIQNNYYNDKKGDINE